MEYAYTSVGPTLHIVSLVMIFALLAGVLVVAFQLAGLPGKIAFARNHPHAEAVNVCGWVGLPTGGFWIVALVWAFMYPKRDVTAGSSGGELRALADQVAKLEQLVGQLETRSGGAR